MEPQQLAGKVAQLESRVATLEDEGKIVKGEIKQILTEIRTAVLVRENPFDTSTASPPPSVNITATAPEPVAKVELVMPKPEEPAPPTADHATLPGQPAAAARPPYASAAPQPFAPAPLYVAPAQPPVTWSLLTIAGLAAWGEDAVRRLGPLRLEILLDLCEAAGHISPAARAALGRIPEIDAPEPEQPPSPNETASLLRQLDALVNDDDSFSAARRSA